MTTIEPDRMLRPGEAARLLRISTETLRTYALAGRIRAYQLPDSSIFRYRAADVVEFAANRIPPEIRDAVLALDPEDENP